MVDTPTVSPLQLQAQQAALSQQQQRLAMQQHAQPSGPPASLATGKGGLSQETMARLQQLAALEKQGTLTPEEFAQQKAKILGS